MSFDPLDRLEQHFDALKQVPAPPMAFERKSTAKTISWSLLVGTAAGIAAAIVVITGAPRTAVRPAMMAGSHAEQTRQSFELAYRSESEKEASQWSK